MSSAKNEIVVEMKPSPQWGKTSHDAALTCPHGTHSWTVFGDEGQRTRMALEMVPAFRSLTRCQCSPATSPVNAS